MTIPGFQQIIELIQAGLQGLYQLTGGAGLSIMLFTLIAMLVLIPLNLPTLRNQRRQQELAPEIRAVQKKHGKDRAAAAMETQRLYQRYGFNPLAGCLPSLVQLPFFFAMWWAIDGLRGTPMGNQPFLWVPQISSADPLFILPVLAAVAQFVQTRMYMPPRHIVLDPQQQQMNRILQWMPFFFVFVTLNVPVGAVLYWIVQALARAATQFVIGGWGSLHDLIPALPHREPRSYLKPPLSDEELQQRPPGLLARMQERAAEAQRLQEEQKGQRDTANGSGGQAPRVSATPATTAPTATAQVIEPEGNRHTEDAWRLPGAPGTTGRAALATGAPTQSAPSGPKPAQQQRVRSSGGMKNKKRR